MNIFDNKELMVDILYDAIRAESQRIVNLELATVAEVKELVDLPIKKANSAEEGNSTELIATLSSIYNVLSNVKLPGDFPKIEKVADEVNEACHCKVREIKAEPKPVTQQNERIKKAMNLVLSRLEQIAYDLGKNGNHTAAYQVECKMKDIASLIVSGTLLISEGQYEKANS